MPIATQNQSQPLRITQQYNSQVQGGATKQVSVHEFCKELINNGKRIGTNKREELDSGFVRCIDRVCSKLLDPHRFAKVTNHLFKTSTDDGGNMFSSFTESWSKIMGIQENPEPFRMLLVKGIVQAVDRALFSFNSFSSIHNQLNVVIQQLSLQSILSVCTQIEERVQEDRQANQRWKDCVFAVLHHLKSLKCVNDANGKKTTGPIHSQQLLISYLKMAKNPVIFKHLLCISSELGHVSIADQLLESVFLLLDDEQEKGIATWKIVHILNHLGDEKRLPSIIRRCLIAWPLGEVPSNTICSIVELTIQCINDYPSIGKAILSIFKSERGLCLQSEYGFLLLLCMCGMERFKHSVLPEFQRSIIRIFRFSDDSSDIGWLSTTKTNGIQDIVERQLCFVCDRVSQSSQCHLLSSSSISLAYSLLEGNQQKQVLIVDGRVSEGPPIWILASRVLSAAILSRPSNISNSLLPLLRAISTASNGNNNNAALLLIDVLLELVKKCTVEVLNNYKLLDGLFSWVSHMRRDVSVSLIRCLLPVINQRPQLRKVFFECLKNDLLSSSTVSSAVPLLLLLFRSVSQRKINPLSQGQMSQSFATFSTQNLSEMGLSRGVDQVLSLEIVGVLRRCLAQPSQTRAALYKGMTEVVSRNPHMVGPCLDMLLSHAETVPQWTPKEMIISSRSVTEVREPLPQLIQAIECLTSDAISSLSSDFSETDGNDLLIAQSEKILSKWVEMAIEKDVHDMNVDKLSEWSPTSPDGRSNLLFSHLLIAVYDTIVEHIWRKLHVGNEKSDADSLIGIMKRRRELLEVLGDKTVRRKETKIGMGNESNQNILMDMEQTDTTTAARTIANVFKRTIGSDFSEDDIVFPVKEDLFEWCLDRSIGMSELLISGIHPLHSTQSQTAYLMEIARMLLSFYTSDGCAEWESQIEMTHPLKTKAIVVYSNIIRFLITKYRTTLLQNVVPIWEVEEKAGGYVGGFVRHAHFWMNKRYTQLLFEDRKEEGDSAERKRGGLEIEKQAKTIMQLCSSLLLACDGNKKAAHAFFKFGSRILTHNTFANISILRDCLRCFSLIYHRLIDCERESTKIINILCDEVLALLSNQNDGDPSYQCVERSTVHAITDFLIGLIEKNMSIVRSLTTFSIEFLPKTEELHPSLLASFQKCDSCLDLIIKLIPLHTEYGIQKEKMTSLLSTLYSSIEMPVKMLLDFSKSLPQLTTWKCMDKLASVVKKLGRLMGECDQHVGLFDPKSDLGKGKQSTKIARCKREESLFVRYVRSRESLQGRVLMLCSVTKDNRLDLQIKNNSIGQRDFRLDMKAVRETLERRENGRENIQNEGTRKKKAKPRESREGDGEEVDEEPPKKKARGRGKKATTQAGE